MSDNPKPSTLSGRSLRPDEPIRSKRDDQLARGRLVDVIGEHILVTDALESVVIALNAPWGAGKSSFLNLLEARLVPETESGSGPTAPPLIIRFNPWHYGSVDQLARMFFAESARGIGTAGKQDLGKKIGQLLNVAGALVSVFSSEAGTVLKDAGGAFQTEKDLVDIKADLDKLLPELNRRVVVFVDDIDRIERETLRLMFRLVRLIADFRNVTYILAFDRLVVERNLDEENGIRGRDYLEKIIQVSFDIPEPEPETLQGVLFAEMDAVLGSLPTRRLDLHRWGNLFHSGFKDHFRTIRHIKRYTNGLRLTLAPIAEEVDLVDFLAVELVRVFHPEVYWGVARGKDMLAPELDGSLRGVSADHLRQWTEALCSQASPGFEASVKQLLRQLFPELARTYSNTTYGDGHRSEWRKSCRVCSPDVFDKFFLLSVPVGEISEVEMIQFVEMLGNADATVETLNRALAAGRARRLLERLEDFTGELPAERARNLLRAMFNLGDRLRFKSRGMFDILANHQVGRIIYQSAQRIESEQDRCAILVECVQEGAALYTAVQVTAISEPRPESSREPLVSDVACWGLLRDAALNRIRQANVDGTLWSLEELPFVLFRWMHWSTEEEVRAAVASHVAHETENLVEFVSRFVDESHSLTEGDKVSRTRRYVKKKNLSRLLDLDTVTARLKGVRDSGEEAAAACELLDLVERPEDPWDELE